MTSIHWVPTFKSPKLNLSFNCSDHVHYYQGGRGFRYIIFHPDNGDLKQVILGPDLDKGHKLQVCVEGGAWKCGHIVNDNFDGIGKGIEGETDAFEYALIGEAVAPGEKDGFITRSICKKAFSLNLTNIHYFI